LGGRIDLTPQHHLQTNFNPQKLPLLTEGCYWKRVHPNLPPYCQEYPSILPTLAYWEQFYVNWIRYVKTVIPQERLLVFNVKEGVKPLEKFLDLDLPEGFFLSNIKILKKFILRLFNAVRSRVGSIRANAQDDQILFFRFHLRLELTCNWCSFAEQDALHPRSCCERNDRKFKNFNQETFNNFQLFICSCVNKNTNMNTEGFKFTDLLPKFK
jgi:hypothetical protein